MGKAVTISHWECTKMNATGKADGELPDHLIKIKWSHRPTSQETLVYIA